MNDFNAILPCAATLGESYRVRISRSTETCANQIGLPRAGLADDDASVPNGAGFGGVEISGSLGHWESLDTEAKNALAVLECSNTNGESHPLRIHNEGADQQAGPRFEASPTE